MSHTIPHTSPPPPPPPHTHSPHTISPSPPGLLNPLDCPHHMRVDDVCPYREGVVCEPAVKDGPKKKRRGPLVDCGMKQVLLQYCIINKLMKIAVQLLCRLFFFVRKW